MFWALAILLAAVAGLFVAAAARAPAGHDAPAEEGALAVYRDQLAEIERERERGLIGDPEAEAATLEVQRRMLRAGRAASTAPGGRAAGGAGGAVIAAALCVPLVGGGLYALTGAPGQRSAPLEERAGERALASRAQAAAATLARRIGDAGEAAAPEDRAALAQALTSLGRYAEAAAALEPVASRDDAPSGLVTLWVEARLAAANGAMDVETRAAVDRAVRADPLNPAASYYLSYALETDGDLAAAREVLVRRLAIEAEAPPWAAAFVQGIDRLGARLDLPPVEVGEIVGTAPGALVRRGPTAEAAEAARDMAPEEREAMIRGMVDGLAARLETATDDPAGWLQLARARAVLGEPDAAREALDRARPLVEALPEGAPERDALAALAAQIGG